MTLKSLSAFTGRVAVIATMHRKEEAMAPLLQAQLGVSVQVPPAFDTDAFGTFTRDVKRPGDQLTTARLKAQAALDLTGKTLALASEGSFGPHPQLPFLSCDRELVLLVDPQLGIEVAGEALSTTTNYRRQTVSTVAEALTFAQAVGFPSHALVVIPPTDSGKIHKGLTTEAALTAAVSDTLQDFGSAHLEPDMRALYNPTRMQVIAEATQNLINTLGQTCPQCRTPGFAVVQRRPGLPCQLCGTPTLRTLSLLYRCQRCDHEQEQLFPEGERGADPGQCPYCNP